MRNVERFAEVPAPSPIPKHVAVIMDGNRRWARSRGLPLAEGYRRGIASLRELTRACRDRGVPYLTAFGFSTENWKRDAGEVSSLFDLCCIFAKTEAPGLRKDGVRVQVIGDVDALPSAPRSALASLVESTKAGRAVTLNLAVNYSGRAEMVAAVRQIARDVHAGIIDPERVDETVIESRLYTAGMPDPDLLIRPGGEHRISNFLLYQLAYTELFVSDVNWPDFNREHFDAALVSYQRRHRRFGAT
ncbi:MAG TPA: polyprenyl diphosphate synthase [Candidatus Eremiobacteraceae bacterium]|nr:polyprenyl diphosphate synthase [Candidatus Eremiobacteraceae bacterium]